MPLESQLKLIYTSNHQCMQPHTTTIEIERGGIKTRDKKRNLHSAEAPVANF